MKAAPKSDEEANDGFSLLPTSTKASSEESSSSSEYTDRKSPREMLRLRRNETLPPLFIDIQEEIEANLQEINNQCKLFMLPSGLVIELRKLQQKRIGESFFEEDETVQIKISSTTNVLTTLIKKSEIKLKELASVDTGDDPCNDQSK